MTDARAGLRAAGDRLERSGDWYGAPGTFASDPGPTGAFLVPTYDESTIAYRAARIVVAREPPRPGLIQRPIVVEGRTVGSWRRVAEGRSVVLEATLLLKLPRAQARALETAAARFAGFLQRPVELRTARA